jgi:hypothetical protein
VIKFSSPPLWSNPGSAPDLNGAADTLSRKPVHSSELYAISQVQPVWLGQVVASYGVDASAQEKLQKLQLDPSSVPGYTLSAGILPFGGRILVGNDSKLQAQIISAFYDSPVGGHILAFH